MAGLIPDAQIASFTGAAYSGFVTFRREFVVNKEPIKTYASLNSNGLVGYGSTSQVTNVTLASVSGIFSGVLVYPKESQFEANSFTKTNSVYDGKALLKVEIGARRYIESGKTESIMMDDIVWNIDGPCRVSNYLGLKFYYYPLVQTR